MTNKPTRHDALLSAIHKGFGKSSQRFLSQPICEAILAEIEKLDKTLEPMAYAVFMPKGHEFDYKVFPTFEEADDECIDIADSLEEGEIAPKPIPLFSLD